MFLGEARHTDFPGENIPPFPGAGHRAGMASGREVYAASRQRGEGQGVFLVSAFSQSPSAQSRPYGKAGYFREARSEPPSPLLYRQSSDSGRLGQRKGHIQTRGNSSLADGGSGTPARWLACCVVPVGSGLTPHVLLLRTQPMTQGEDTRAATWESGGGDTAQSRIGSCWETSTCHLGAWGHGSVPKGVPSGWRWQVRRPGYNGQAHVDQGRGLAHWPVEHCGHVLGTPFPVR